MKLRKKIDIFSHKTVINKFNKDNKINIGGILRCFQKGSSGYAACRRSRLSSWRAYQKLAKPAVPFGGKYRIIDFPLSNCVNSGIDAVGILTQYQPLVLNEYIGNGQPWDLDSMHSGVNCLSPYQAVDGADWYSGTANAIYQNINYIERYNPEYVVILSGDHIYKMDYNKMLEYHKEKNAACTIAVIDVSLEEASRFGILNTNEDGSIYEFEEKPAHPKSTNASMGIYIFSWKELKKYLTEDEFKEGSSHDFGKDVLLPCLTQVSVCLHILLKAIGRMWEQSTAFGRLIWIFSIQRLL